MFHPLYVTLYYMISYFFPAVMASLDIPFKKGKKWLCLSVCYAIQMIPAIIAVILNSFPTGKEPTPWWFYLGQIACLLPLYLWCEGNVFLNWLNYFIVGYVGTTILQFPIGLISAVFIKDPHPIRYESELSSLPFVAFFILVNTACICFNLYYRFTMQKIIRRKWLANTLFLVYSLPFVILGYWDIMPENTFRARLHLWNGLLSIILFPVSIALLQGIHLLVSAYRNRQAVKQLKEESKILFHQYESVSRLARDTSFLRHDIRNHLSVLETLTMKMNADDTRKIEDFLLSTNRILDNTRSIKTIEYTEYPVLNSLFSIKAAEAADNQIDLKYSLVMPKQSPLSDYELVSLFSNLLDNALEASLRLPRETRKVSLLVYSKSDYLCIDLKNHYSACTDPVDSSFHTTKTDSRIHGFGMQIISDIVRKHNGKEDIKKGDKTAASETGSFPVFHIFIAISLS